MLSLFNIYKHNRDGTYDHLALDQKLSPQTCEVGYLEENKNKSEACRRDCS